MAPELPLDFRHEALLYAGTAEFSSRSAAFIREGLEADEHVLVAVCPAKIEALREELDDDADLVQFVDMEVLGLNPARIIPAWRAFLDWSGNTGVRGVGEPIWAGRSPAELVEAQRHEALLNVAFVGSGSWRLLCPYDTSALPEEVIEEARHSHPQLRSDGQLYASSESHPEQMAGAHLDSPLPEPTVPFHELTFTFGELRPARQLVESIASRVRMGVNRAHDFALAVGEVSTNSVLHGGGGGVLRVWVDDGSVICEIRDQGQISDPLVGRTLPDRDSDGQRGLWMVNQLCDLVQIRVFPSGTVVRIHMAVA